MTTVEAPREGLPLCLRQTVFEDRSASLSDASKCTLPGPLNMPVQFRIVACVFDRYDYDYGHPEYFVAWGVPGSELFVLDTDDRAEAEAAYARGCEWVLSGVLPEKKA